MMTDDDLFEPLFNLEDQFYKEGYQLGVADGTRDGRVEGRAFGIEKGFEKFLEMGRLHGRSIVWSSRMRMESHRDSHSHDSKGDRDTSSLSSQVEGAPKTKIASNNNESTLFTTLPPFPDNPRLEKHIHTLMNLTDPAQFSFENNEDAVSDFDDRLKRARAKVKIIEKIVHEATPEEGPEGVTSDNADDRHEDHADAMGAEGNIEDPTQLSRTLGHV